MRVAVLVCVLLCGCTFVGGMHVYKDAVAHNARIDEARRKEVRVKTYGDEMQCRQHRITILQAAGSAATPMERDEILETLKTCVRVRGDEDDGRRSEVLAMSLGALGGLLVDAFIVALYIYPPSLGVPATVGH